MPTQVEAQIAGNVWKIEKAAGDPVDIYVNGRRIARGEVLVLNENFCIRVSEIVEPQTRTAELYLAIEDPLAGEGLPLLPQLFIGFANILHWGFIGFGFKLEVMDRNIFTGPRKPYPTAPPISFSNWNLEHALDCALIFSKLHRSRIHLCP